MPFPSCKFNSYGRGLKHTSLIVKNDGLTNSKENLDKECAIQVKASAELKVIPDRVRIQITIQSNKDTAADAKNSVTRRLEYVTQTLKSYNVEPHNITVLSHLFREGLGFRMVSEVVAVMTNFVRCLEVVNLFTEKLDKSVTVSEPDFYHSSGRIEKLKTQVCLEAVKNAHQKAQEIAQAVGSTLGAAISVLEEDSSQKVFEEHEVPDCNTHYVTIQNRINYSAAVLSSKVVAKYCISDSQNSKR